MAGFLLRTGGEVVSRDPRSGILGSWNWDPRILPQQGNTRGGQFKPPLQQKFGRIRNMKTSLQWERRQRGRIYSSNSRPKVCCNQKKVNESAAFWTLGRNKATHLGVVCLTASAYFGKVETTQDVPFAFGMHLDLKQSSIQDRHERKKAGKIFLKAPASSRKCLDNLLWNSLSRSTRHGYDMRFNYLYGLHSTV